MCVPPCTLSSSPPSFPQWYLDLYPYIVNTDFIYLFIHKIYMQLCVCVCVCVCGYDGGCFTILPYKMNTDFIYLFLFLHKLLCQFSSVGMCDAAFCLMLLCRVRSTVIFVAACVHVMCVRMCVCTCDVCVRIVVMLLLFLVL